VLWDDGKTVVSQHFFNFNFVILQTEDLHKTWHNFTKKRKNLKIYIAK